MNPRIGFVAVELLFLAIAALALKPRNALSKISRAWTLWTLVSRFLR